MKRAIRIAGVAALLGAGFALGGCVYDPAYYHRTGAVYSSGNAAVDYDDGYYYSSPDYYYPADYGPGPYWGPYYGGWGWPYVSLGIAGRTIRIRGVDARADTQRPRITINSSW